MIYTWDDMNLNVMHSVNCYVQIISPPGIQRTKQGQLEELGFGLGLEVLLKDGQKKGTYFIHSVDESKNKSDIFLRVKKQALQACVRKQQLKKRKSQ